jgi:hypothetical protein
MAAARGGAEEAFAPASLQDNTSARIEGKRQDQAC